MSLITIILICFAGVSTIYSAYKLITTQAKIRWAVNWILTLVVSFMIYYTYDTIMDPIKFREGEAIRIDAVKQNLIDIRKAQIAMKDSRGNFTNDFDELIDFIKNDSLTVQRSIGKYPEDEMTLARAIDSGLVITKLKDGQTVEDIIAKGLALRDTVQLSFSDTLFDENFQIDSLKYIPYSGGEVFRLDTGRIETGSGVVVEVFEVVATKRQYLKGLSKNYYRPGEEMRVGSLTEVTNHAGNWGE